MLPRNQRSGASHWTGGSAPPERIIEQVQPVAERLLLQHYFYAYWITLNDRESPRLGPVDLRARKEALLRPKGFTWRER